jgi:cytochrome c-type biogenesis protein
MTHDVSIPAALIAGVISFLSPCVLPLVPPYLIYLTGATIEHFANDGPAAASRRAVMVSALLFVLASPPCSWRSAQVPAWSAA